MTLEEVSIRRQAKLLCQRGELLTRSCQILIEASGVDKIAIRSVLVCETRNGVCASCYGRDLARGTMVNVGEAVGVIAAQSIGEPGTQLTMRTFHIGGAAQRGAEQSSVEAVLDANIKIKNRNVVINSEGNPIVMNRHTEILLLDENGRERSNPKCLMVLNCSWMTTRRSNQVRS